VFLFDTSLVFSENAITSDVEAQIAEQVSFRNILMFYNVRANSSSGGAVALQNVTVEMKMGESVAASSRFVVYVRNADGVFQAVSFERDGDVIRFNASDLAAILIVELAAFNWWIFLVIIGVLILIFSVALIMKRKNLSPAYSRGGRSGGRHAPSGRGGGRSSGNRGGGRERAYRTDDRPTNRKGGFDRDPMRANKKRGEDVVYMNDPDLRFNHNTNAHNVHFNSGYGQQYGTFAQQQQQQQPAQSIDVYETIEVEEADMFRQKPKY
jgi:hypothetical protein